MYMCTCPSHSTSIPPAPKPRRTSATAAHLIRHTLCLHETAHGIASMECRSWRTAYSVMKIKSKNPPLSDSNAALMLP